MTLAVVALGTRELIVGSLPLVGQLAPLPSWTSTWHHFFSGWQSAGVGTTAPASPAFGLAGLSGTVVFGAMSVAQRVLLLGCIPLGAWGMARMTRPLVSARARVASVICYLGLPLPYAALGTGRWDGLVAYAAFPFIAVSLARAAGIVPFAVEAGRAVAHPSAGPGGRPRRAHRCRRRLRPGRDPHGPGGRRRLGGRGSDPRGARAPRAAAGGRVRGRRRGARADGAVGAGDGPGRQGLPGDLRPAPLGRDGTEVGGSGPLRHRTGCPLPTGVAARGVRRPPAGAGPRHPPGLGGAPVGRGIGLVVPGPRSPPRRDLGSFTPSESVVLVPAALAVAVCIGLGIAAFENDLAGRVFGWRQVVSITALVFVVAGVLPVAFASVGGRWGLPAQGRRATAGLLGPALDHRGGPGPVARRSPGACRPEAGRSNLAWPMP